MLITERPVDADWLMERHNFVRGRYQRWTNHIDEVVVLHKGEWVVQHDKDPAQSSHEIVKPAQPRNIVDKLASMIGVRQEMRFDVLPLNQSKRQLRRADFLEKVVEAWWLTIEEEAQRNYRKEIAYGTILFGRQPFILEYKPTTPQLYYPIQLDVVDPRTTFTYFGRFGPQWYTRDYRMQLAELESQFKNLATDVDGISKPNLSQFKSKDTNDWAQSVRVVEYTNAKYRCYAIEGTEFAGPLEHDYGFLPLVEPRFKTTPYRDEERYASDSVLGPVMDDLKGIAILAAKISTGMEETFYPFMVYETEDGSPMIVHSNNLPLEWIPMKPGTKPAIFSPTPNHEGVDWLMNFHQTNVSDGTVPRTVFLQDIPDNTSGFMMNTILGVIKDQVDDQRDVLQRAYGTGSSYSLRMHREFADAQGTYEEDDDGEITNFTPGKFRLPAFINEEAERTGNNPWLAVGRDDIDEEHRVRVHIKLDLPVDEAQKVAMGVQMRTPDATGRPLFSLQTAHETMGVVNDISQEISRVEREALIASQDPQVAEREMTMAVARYMADTQEEYEDSLKVLEKVTGRQEKVLEKQNLKEFARGLFIPAEDKLNADLFLDLYMAVQQGMDPALILEGGGQPLANPLEQQPGVPPQQPTGQVGQAFTGQEEVDAANLPPPMTGALPRQSTDQANLEMERQFQRSRRFGPRVGEEGLRRR